MSFIFKPKLVPTLFTIPALVLLLGLSYWQFQRLHWKQEIINRIDQESQLPPLALLENLTPSQMFYRKVKLKGHFMHQFEMHMYGGSRKFKGEVGYYILTPLILSNNKIVIINRGWVPEVLKDPKTRPETLTQGLVEIDGTVMPGEKKGLYIHDNQPERNLWFYINLLEIQNILKRPIDDFYILASENPNPKILPLGHNLERNIRNHHLGYALTWLAAAISLLVIYITYTYNSTRDKE